MGNGHLFNDSDSLIPMRAHAKWYSKFFCGIVSAAVCLLPNVFVFWLTQWLRIPWFPSIHSISINFLWKNLLSDALQIGWNAFARQSIAWWKMKYTEIGPFEKCAARRFGCVCCVHAKSVKHFTIIHFPLLFLVFLLLCFSFAWCPGLVASISRFLSWNDGVTHQTSS